MGGQRTACNTLPACLPAVPARLPTHPPRVKPTPGTALVAMRVPKAASSILLPLLLWLWLLGPLRSVAAARGWRQPLLVEDSA